MNIKGKAKVDPVTKNLVKRILPNDIAVLCHKDIDEVAAQLLIEKKVKAVINGEMSMSGHYPNQGPCMLAAAGIPIIDHIGTDNFIGIHENDIIEYKNDSLYVNNRYYCEARIFSKKDIEERLSMACRKIESLLEDFLDNTLMYAQKEKAIVLKEIVIPKINAEIRNRHVLIVARGRNYKEDLRAIRSYIDEMHPVIIGVDGGADALIENNYTPDIVIGDMDSVSDMGLIKAKEIVVHAYPDGRSPGLNRVTNLHLHAEIFPFPGTSEDIAMLLAYESGASLIVAVGTHNSMLDFLEKGRKGMASTLLIRMKMGNILVDARGVSQLYRNRIKLSYFIGLMISALFPLVMIFQTSPTIQYFYRLIGLQIKLLFNWM